MSNAWEGALVYGYVKYDYGRSRHIAMIRRLACDIWNNYILCVARIISAQTQCNESELDLHHYHETAQHMWWTDYQNVNWSFVADVEDWGDEQGTNHGWMPCEQIGYGFGFKIFKIPTGLMVW